MSTEPGDSQDPERVRSLPAFACGLAMGCADGVPGVSGGTIALILGIYERLIAAISDLLHSLLRPLDAHARRVAASALAMLVPLGVGVALALVGVVLLLVGEKPDLVADAAAMRERLEAAPGLLINPNSAPFVFALFFGLVLASIPEPWRRRRSTHALDWPLAGLGALLAAGLSLMPALGTELNTLTILLAGAIAISVMLLPGISGSLALLVLGLYQPVAGLVHERDPRLALFVCGIGIGLATAVPLLRFLLTRAHDRTMAFLRGLIAGSLAALWPWKPHYFPEAIPMLGPMHPTSPDERWHWVLVVMLLSAAATAVIARFGRGRNGPGQLPA